MQGFVALLMSGVLAAAVPAARQSVVHADAVVADMGEAYVAELDADWNVTREIRVACPVDAGCAVDLSLPDAHLAAVHVRFDAPKAGSVAVSSRLEDRDGRASAAEADTLSLDRTGFGASHHEARMSSPDADGHVIMVAVRVPGWAGPGTSTPASGAQRT